MSPGWCLGGVASLPGLSPGVPLTARYMNPYLWTVQFGEVTHPISVWNLRAYLNRYRVQTITMHPVFSSGKFNDITLLRLASSVSFTKYVQPVCVKNTSAEFINREDCWITGWGWNGEDGLGRRLGATEKGAGPNSWAWKIAVSSSSGDWPLCPSEMDRAAQGRLSPSTDPCPVSRWPWSADAPRASQGGLLATSVSRHLASHPGPRGGGLAAGPAAAPTGLSSLVLALVCGMTRSGCGFLESLS